MDCCPPTFVFTSPPPCPKQNGRKGKGRRSGKKKICIEMNGSNNSCSGQDRKKAFMEQVWKSMTPDMLNKLVDILVQDFNMSRAEACAFIKTQRDQSKQAQILASGKCPCATDVVSAIPSMDVRNRMVKEFLDVAACTLSDYMGMVLGSRRNKRQKTVAELMLENMNSFFGVQEGDKIASVNAFIADKLALWLIKIFDDTCCEDLEGGNGEEPKKEDSKKDDANEAEGDPPPAEE